MSDPFKPVGRVRLAAGREDSLLRRHPWIYRGALAQAVPPGTGPVRVESADGRHLGIALPGGSGGSLALRMVAFPGESWGAGELSARLGRAAALRERLALDADAYRLVHAEGDDLPGLVIDRYGAVAVAELFEPAWEAYLGHLTSFLASMPWCRTVLVRRAFAPSRRPEVSHGRAPDAPFAIREGNVRFLVDVIGGQKTGFYLDQRDNRRRLAALASAATVLNLFSYSGGFALAALGGGARRAVNVDASEAALALARDAVALNGHQVAGDDFVRGDGFEVVRELVAARQAFDIVVVDPPAFVKRRGELEGGLRGYRDINIQAMRLVAPGGLLLTCSCSALVGEEHFGAALSSAALDAGRRVRLLERRGAGPDHPVSLHCPETRHLKAWLCSVS